MEGCLLLRQVKESSVAAAEHYHVGLTLSPVSRTFEIVQTVVKPLRQGNREREIKTLDWKK
jgi:hypothetical protein